MSHWNHSNSCNSAQHCACGPQGRCMLQITSPSHAQQLDSLPRVEGIAAPCETVCITVDHHPPLRATADCNGFFSVDNPYTLAAGAHVVCVQSLPDSCRNRCGCCRCNPFTIAELPPRPNFYVEAIEARMGRTFRTVDVDVLMYGTTGSATVYYLLLPPGSQAPSAADITDYQDTAALLDGSAATGQFDTVVNTAPTTHTWALTGLDKPGAPDGTTGVVDGYRYDVYLYVVSQSCHSEVLTFPAAAMGMPFATGLGTDDNPFTIRELTPEELQRYPDLLADNPLNRPGVDETARQLENIERLITLYEETDGYYGLGDSMALHYLMTSDLDLAGYADAYGGEGWESIGDIDGWINDRKETEHLFSGVLDGGGHTVKNLSITPTATDDNFVGYRGLFGGVEYGTIENLALDTVTINAFTTTPGFAELGSFISIARDPTLTGLTLTNATLTADTTAATVGDPHSINIGGFVGEIYDGATVRDMVGQGIRIEVPGGVALALGGFVGFTDKFEAVDRYESIRLSGLSISGYAMVGGFAGYVVYSVNLLRDVLVEQLSITAPGGQAGGLIGRLYVYEAGGDQLIERCEVRGSSISIGGAGDPGNMVGGLIGMMEANPFPTRSAQPVSIPNRVFAERAQAAPAVSAAPVTTIRHCGAVGGQVGGTDEVGGLIGFANVFYDAQTVVVTLCRATVLVSATGAAAGGLIGNSRYVTVSQCYATGTVLAGGVCFGGLLGASTGSVVLDSYATGPCAAGNVGGGLAGVAEDGSISRCCRVNGVTASEVAGGIAGVAIDTTIQNNLVLGGAMQAPAAHRILGLDVGGAPLLNNYALDSVTPVPGAPNPNGLDGGTIASWQIDSTMQSLGWDTATVWNTATVATLGRPTLLQNPE